MEFINQLALTLHNVMRWGILVVVVILLVQAVQGWSGGKTYTVKNQKLAAAYAGLFDFQLLLGVFLFFSKGWGSAMMNSGAELMSTPSVRFFAVEHWMVMLLASIIIHIGSSRIRRIETGLKKFRASFIWYGISLLLILAVIPWPGMAAARPLLRLFGLTL